MSIKISGPKVLQTQANTLLYGASQASISQACARAWR